MMTMTSVFQQNHLREQRLRFIRDHLDAFDVEPGFPLRLFEESVFDIDGICGVEPTCNVEGDRLFAGDFQVSNYGQTWPRSLTDALQFLDKVESRIDVKINRSLLDRFSALYINSNKIENNTIGIDLRPTLQDSLIKIYMHIHPGQGNEELVRTAIALDGAKYSVELTEVLVRDVMVIGFNLFLDGRSHVEIMAGSPSRKYQIPGTFGKYFTAYIKNKFSGKVNDLFDVSDVLAASFSKKNIEPVFYFSFFNIQDIPQYFSFNSLGDRIYDFCQSQDCMTVAGVSAREQDLEGSRLDKYGFFYNKSDTCQSDIDRDRLAGFLVE